MKERILDFYRMTLPSPHADLIAGMVLGAKSSLSKAFWEALKTTGTAHVVVASGMNVTLVAGFLLNFLISIVSRKIAVILTIVGIWIYVVLVGFEAPIIRAAIIGTVAFSAQGLGKMYSAWRALILSALVMLVYQPAWITDLSFILSFVATASLMLFEVKIRRLIYFVPGLFREGLSTSLSAQIGVAPILYIAFGQFNIFSPLINAAVLWTVAPITIIGFISGFVGLVVPFVGKLVLYLAYPLTSWFIWVVGFTS
ncbi:hypothetical protein A3F62_03250 [Candidatus Woesebacteria bacterium RIFCSPHIGHO2_12_FULL_44_11]|nr:MAG: hypothetical protein A3F62_03250 [Candidatus Woesebacteria bacterium RIFCSPHIGHO2_12_FULL_44_11]